MKVSLNRIRSVTRPISQLVLVILLIWLILPETSDTSSSTGKFFKPNTEQVLIHFDLKKQNTVNPISKEITFILQNAFSKRNLDQTCSLIKSFLSVNSFIRNPFYVHTNINAP